MSPTTNDPSPQNKFFLTTKFVGLLCSFVLYQAWRFLLSSKEAVVIHSEKNITTCSDSSYHDEKQATTTVYHLGWDRPYGRTNNHLFIILRGVDQVWDLHGDETCQAVLAISGWALDTFCQLFCDSHWSLEDNDDRLLPIVEHDELLELAAAEANQPVIKLGAHDTFSYSRNASLPQPKKNKKQRRYQVLGILIQHFAERNLESLKLLRLHLRGMAKLDDSLLVEPDGSVPFMVVHSRWLEGSCLKRIENIPSKDECYMPPSYIKKILASQGMLGRIPIVIITDLQQRNILDALRNDPEIGPHVIIPALDRTIFTTSSSSSVQNDMVLAANSAIFVGTRASSMSTMIGMWRVAAGADPQSNYIYVNTKADGSLEVCADCI